MRTLTDTQTRSGWGLGGLRWVLSPCCYRTVVMVMQMELLLLAGTLTLQQKCTHMDTHSNTTFH